MTIVRNTPATFMSAGMLASGLLACAVLSFCVAAADRSEVEGLWASGGSLLQVSQVDDTLKMEVVALEEPLDDQGQPFVDTLNPDESLRTTPMLGMNLLADYRWNGKRWNGKIYDPESGKTYSSHMQKKSGKLEMRGYIGAPMFGKTKKFKPISVCRADMIVMLQNSGITGYCGITAPAEAAPPAAVSVVPGASS